MSRPFPALRGKLIEYDVDVEYLSKLLGRSISYVSSRLMGHGPWALDEMWFIMELIHEPDERLHYYFPRNYNEVSRRKKALIQPMERGCGLEKQKEAIRAIK